MLELQQSNEDVSLIIQRIKCLTDEVINCLELLKIERQRLSGHGNADSINTSKATYAGISRSRPYIPLRNKSPRSRWRKVFQSIYYSGKQPFDYDDLMILAEIEGLSLLRSSLRPKMLIYVEKGLAQRVANGSFRLTADGETYFGVR